MTMAMGENVITRSQTIGLTKGWNAIFLEVEPPETDPSKLFAGTPIDVAAAYFGSFNPSEQFITNPGVNLGKTKGWGIWYSEQRPEAFLKSLGAVYGRRAYLVHAKSAVQWQVSGQAMPTEARWRPDTFNLVGFSVRTQGPPTFAEFFAGSAAHRGQTIYRLVNETWKRVEQADAEAMRSGEAFWIFCKGGSNYGGPLEVELPYRQGVVLQGGSGKVILRNLTSHPVTPTLERVFSKDQNLPVSILITAYGDPENPVKSVALEKPVGAWLQAMPTLEAGKAIAIPMEARTGEMTTSVQGALFKITTDLGTEIWVPIQAINPVLK